MKREGRGRERIVVGGGRGRGGDEDMVGGGGGWSRAVWEVPVGWVSAGKRQGGGCGSRVVVMVVVMVVCGRGGGLKTWSGRFRHSAVWEVPVGWAPVVKKVGRGRERDQGGTGGVCAGGGRGEGRDEDTFF